MRKYSKALWFYAITFLIIFISYAFISSLSSTRNNNIAVEENYEYSDLIVAMESGLVTRIEIYRDANISDMGKAKAVFENNKVTSFIRIPSIKSFMEVVNKNSAIYNNNFRVITRSPYTIGTILQSMLSPIVILIIGSLILTKTMGKIGSGNGKIFSFGSVKSKNGDKDKSKIRFKDVAGLKEEKVELSELVDFLSNANKFLKLGARIPKGVLLIGPPGTGKTLLARAIAGEANVSFFSMSGSDFVEMFVGVGASRVRDLFEQAKKNSPCIIFIDEIDAVGRRRGAGLGGGHDEREQTLNQLLVEMDGFTVNQNVIVVAATNRPDILDPALLRPGRFDRQVVVGVPDVSEREDILKVHAKGKVFEDNIDFRNVACSTAGFTGADLENLLNEAAILAARSNLSKISMEEIRKAFVKVGIGTEKKSRVISKKERKITAYHEAGHAILFETLSELDKVHIISVIPTGIAGGYTMPLPTEDRSYITKKRMEQEIISLLGGRAAESLVLDDITTGASNDIERATKLARAMVTKYGMSEKLGPIRYTEDGNEIFVGRDIGHSKNYSEELAKEIDSEIKNIIKNAYKMAKEIISEHIEVLHKAANLLIKQEKITGDEFRVIFNS